MAKGTNNPISIQRRVVAAVGLGRRGSASAGYKKGPLRVSDFDYELPTELISPHSGSTSDRENGRLTNLFCENLRRYLDGETLLKRVV